MYALGALELMFCIVMIVCIPSRPLRYSARGL